MHTRTAIAAISIACLAGITTAHAALVNVPVSNSPSASDMTWSGSTTLVASTDFENWIGLTRANPFPLDSVSTQQVVVGPFLGVGGAVTGVTYDDSTNRLIRVNTQVGLGLILPADASLAVGGGRAEIRVSQLDLSQPNDVSVYGSIIGTSKAGTAVNFTGVLATTTFGQLSGSTQLGTPSTPLSITANNLMLSSGALGALGAVYQVADTGLAYSGLLKMAPNLGSLNIKVSPGTIPEPTSAVLMGVGIAALGWQARRRSQQA